MTAELIVLVGLPGAGKSSFYRQRFAATHLHVSKDAWPNARKREARQRRIVEEALRAGRSVVVDNTNPSPVERAPLVAIARAAGARAIAYFFPVPFEEASARNALRAGRARVPDAGLRSVAKRLVPPTADEGFDEIHIV